MSILSHQALMMAGGGGGGGDPYFAFVKSLLHYEASFSDEKGLTWSTGAGSPSIDTSSPIVGAGSGVLASACIYTPGSSSYRIAPSQDFAIEACIIFNSLPSSGAYCIASMYSNSGTGWSFQFRNDGGSRLQINLSGDGGTSSASWTPVTGTRYDLAVTRVSGVVRFFVNGTQVGTDDTNAAGSSGYSTTNMVIGGLYVGAFAQLVDAKIDETRLTIGAGRYATNYTPSFPFPDS